MNWENHKYSETHLGARVALLHLMADQPEAMREITRRLGDKNAGKFQYLLFALAKSFQEKSGPTAEAEKATPRD